MPDFQVGDRTFTIDEDGFIQEPDKWDQEVASALATTEGVEELHAQVRAMENDR